MLGPIRKKRYMPGIVEYFCVFWSALLTSFGADI